MKSSATASVLGLAAVVAAVGKIGRSEQSWLLEGAMWKWDACDE